uniref:Uncharacterized protein n=1 Tax=Ditylenchus dipsaci TaxID=166011 RepID=A0A915DHL1_9BILA
MLPGNTTMTTAAPIAAATGTLPVLLTSLNTTLLPPNSTVNSTTTPTPIAAANPVSNVSSPGAINPNNSAPVPTLI